MLIPKYARKPPMKSQMIRLPIEAVEKASKIAKDHSTEKEKITPTDVYRTAILVFLGILPTDSSDTNDEGENS